MWRTMFILIIVGIPSLGWTQSDQTKVEQAKTAFRTGDYAQALKLLGN